MLHLSFQQLMSLMKYADTQGKDFCVVWLPDGKSFVIKNPDEFTRYVVPKFFKVTKFSSFTRKLYRWGFRQINRGIGPDDPIIFGNDNFDRDAEQLISKMRSITAAASRKDDSPPTFYGATGRSYDAPLEESDKQRLLYDHILQQKATNMMQQNAPVFGGMNANGTLPLTHALCPNMGIDHKYSASGHQSANGSNGNALGKFDMMNHHQQLLLQHPNSLMHQFNMHGQGMSNMPFPNPQSTAEIVNAAIAALRYAN